MDYLIFGGCDITRVNIVIIQNCHTIFFFLLNRAGEKNIKWGLKSLKLVATKITYL